MVCISLFFQRHRLLQSLTVSTTNPTFCNKKFKSCICISLALTEMLAVLRCKTYVSAQQLRSIKSCVLQIPDISEILLEHSQNSVLCVPNSDKRKSSIYLNQLHKRTMQLLLEPVRQSPEPEDLVSDDFSNAKYSVSAMNMERFLFPVQQCERSQIICHSC